MVWLKLVYSDVNNILFFLVGSFPPSQPGKIFLKRDAAALKVGERAFGGTIRNGKKRYHCVLEASMLFLDNFLMMSFGV